MYFELREVHKYSETIHAGFIHKVLQLKFDSDGPTEIGGLMLEPSFRRHPKRLGRQLSFSRFMWVKMRRRWFKNFILSELMPPLTDSGQSVLWEAVGRRFTNLSYQEADALSRKNKEFVTSLFPTGSIYTCLLSGEARDALGKVGQDTEPVRHMLEKIGFEWKDHIDPFDGGPHYWAPTKSIIPVRNTQAYRVMSENSASRKKHKSSGLCAQFVHNEFACVHTDFDLVGGRVQLPKPVLELLNLTVDSRVFILKDES